MTMGENPLSHLDADNRARMVDVSGKAPTARTATASARVRLGAAILGRLEGGELTLAKGAVFHTAILAGIMAAKRTPDLVPLCHAIALEGCEVRVAPLDAECVGIEATARTVGRTGVEMEALVAASAAALTIYDMCKALSHDIRIEEVRLEAKTGGRNDFLRDR